MERQEPQDFAESGESEPLKSSVSDNYESPIEIIEVADERIEEKGKLSGGGVVTS